MANQVPDLLQNPSNPFYLHPNENPSLVLVSPILTGENHHTWARAMRVALISKNKLGFVDGTILAPSTTDPMYSIWERCNTMVLSWINHSISSSIAQSILWIEKAYEAWSDLKERFSKPDVLLIANLLEQFHGFQQGNLSVIEYFNHLKSLWDELENLRPLPSCECTSPCQCGAFDVMRVYRQIEYVMKFLKGLNDQFAHVRSHIMLLEPLPSINKAFSMVLDREKGSSEAPKVHQPKGHITIQVPEPDSKQDHDQHPKIKIKSNVGKGVQRSFSTASNLGNFLPTGTNLLFGALLPIIYESGRCSTLNNIMMVLVLALCAFFSFILSFTDSLELSCGKQRKTIYGFVTAKGLWVYNHKGFIQEDRYKLEFGDFLHATMSLVVFLVIAFSDHRVIDCLFPRYVNDVEQVMQILVLVVGFVCSSLFLLFPVHRRGFVPSLPKNVSS